MSDVMSAQPGSPPTASTDPSPAGATEAYKPTLAELKRMVEDSQFASAEGRKQSLIDGDYYYGYQWTADEKQVLRRRNQPDNVFNMVRLAVNGTLGVIKQGQTDPRAYPRNPQDEDAADVASKTLRFIADQSQFAALKIDVAFDYLTPGTGAVIIELDDGKIVATHVRWEEFVYDPRSRRQDFRDARYKGIAKWMYADDVAEAYPEAQAQITATVQAGPVGLSFLPDQTMRDRPDSATPMAWVDSKRRRLMVIELYHRDNGQWWRCVFHSGGILSAEPSPYLDERGRPMCPIEAQSCYVDLDNNRSGIVRDMRGPADEINKRHSKLLHLLTMRQVQEVSPGSGVGDADTVRAEAAKPDGVIPSGWQIAPNSDVIAGQVQMLGEAKAFMERFAPNPATIGRAPADSSGRAQLLRQQSGLTELAVIFGGIEEWELRCYRQMWARAKQFWTAPDWIRVTDDEGAPQFVGINQPKGPPVIDPATGQQVVDPNTGQPAEGPPMADPATGQPMHGVRNQIAQLDVDIILDTVPNTANIQAEQFNILAELAKMYPQDVTFDDLLRCSSMPNKSQVLESRKARQSQPQQPNPLVVAKVKNLDSMTELNLTKAFATLGPAAMAGQIVPDMAPPAQALQPAMPTQPGAPIAQPAPQSPPMGQNAIVGNPSSGG